jgi:diadenosine tetraphosphate (Ap4A) HIT family hydrolase
VVWNAHVAELTDLAAPARAHLFDVVCAVEAVLRARLSPTKMNLATLGNLTPHLHWHVIPRFADDSHFPHPVWGAPRRPGRARVLPADFAPVLAGDLAAALGASAPA